jgi:hypothetical protein
VDETPEWQCEKRESPLGAAARQLVDSSRPAKPESVARRPPDPYVLILSGGGPQRLADLFGAGLRDQLPRRHFALVSDRVPSRISSSANASFPGHSEV